MAAVALGAIGGGKDHFEYDVGGEAEGVVGVDDAGCIPGPLTVDGDVEQEAFVGRFLKAVDILEARFLGVMGMLRVHGRVREPGVLVVVDGFCPSEREPRRYVVGLELTDRRSQEAAVRYRPVYALLGGPETQVAR